MSVKNEIRTALESGLALDSQIAIREWGTTRLASYVCMLRADACPFRRGTNGFKPGAAR